MMSKRDTAGKPPHQSSLWCQSFHPIYVLIKTVQPLLSQRSVESQEETTGRLLCLCSPVGTIVLSQGPDHLPFKCQSSLDTKAKLPLSPDIRRPRRFRNKNTKIPGDGKICGQKYRNEASFGNVFFGQLQKKKENHFTSHSAQTHQPISTVNERAPRGPKQNKDPNSKAMQEHYS